MCKKAIASEGLFEVCTNCYVTPGSTVTVPTGNRMSLTWTKKPHNPKPPRFDPMLDAADIHIKLEDWPHTKNSFR